jgi:hypothetical protein
VNQGGVYNPYEAYRCRFLDDWQLLRDAVRSGLWGYYRGDYVLSPTSIRGWAQVGMRDRCQDFSKLPLCLPAHRLERKGKRERRIARLEFEQVLFVEHKRTDLRSISSYYGS